MKTYVKLLTLISLLACATPVAAQTYNTTTTLSTAITDRTCNSRTLNIASTTGWSAGMQFYIDHELFNVNSVVSSTQVTATRCVASTSAELHTASSVVIWGPASMFQIGDTDGQGRATYGACTATNYQYLPIVNVVNGNVWLCRAFGSSAPTTSTQWTGTNSTFLTYNSLLTKLP